MNSRHLTRLVAVVALLSLGAAAAASTPHPFGSSISIHGRLAPLGKGVPTPDGLHEIRYLIFDAMTGGTQLASTSTPSVDVINGIFADTPDFGTEVFSQEGSRFMEVGIRPAGSSEAFQRFQRVEVKPHPRAQFAGEIFLPEDKTVTIGAGSTALKITNTGTGGTAELVNTNPTRVDPVVKISSNPTSTAETLQVAGRTNINGTLKVGIDPLFATFVVDETGVLVADDFRVTGKATFDGAVNFNQPADFNDTVEMTSGKSISQAFGSVIISNTNPTGRALLAFNQMGGEGVFGSSINGRGVVGDGTGPSSVALTGITNNGRAGVFQNLLSSTTNPTVQVTNLGTGTALHVNQSNPAATGASGVNIVGLRTNTGLKNGMESRFTGNVALGGDFDPIHPLQHTSGAHLTSGGSFTSASSRALKEDFQPVDPRQILDKVAQLPVTTWKYLVESDGVRHLGPTAEDFAAAFGLGETDTGIGAIDADGVALSAIQGLHQLVQEKDAQIAQLSARLERLESLLDRLDPQSAGR